MFINLGDGQSGPEIIEGDENFPVASAILQTKLLEESGWGINSLDALHKKHIEFTNFAADNYAHLAHSDQISALIRQSFMMLELVNYIQIP